jgi:hypothetical protein
MEYRSVNFNAAKIELKALAETPDGASALQAQLGGAVVADYDAQIRSFTAELTVVNAEKNEIQADKVSLTSLMAGLSDIPEAKGYAYKDESGTTQKFSGKAYIMSEGDYAKFENLARSVGVKTDAVAVNGKSRAVPESLLQAVKDGLDSKLSGLNSASELKLIHYQSLMDARKQSMMLLSNMIGSDNQTRMAVIQNMKG